MRRFFVFKMFSPAVGPSSLLSGAGNYFYLLNIQTFSEAHRASYAVGTGVLFPGIKRLVRDVSHHLYLAPRLRMNGFIASLPLCD